jgi:hypothetical protein
MGRDFFQDTAIGRVFHPRTRSFRQVCATDSAHVVVDADHRVSVHVDRVSPLLVKAGRACRYSIVRAVAHNVNAGWTALCRLVRRDHASQACHLDCEIVWVPDDEAA